MDESQPPADDSALAASVAHARDARKRQRTARISSHGDVEHSVRRLERVPPGDPPIRCSLVRSSSKSDARRPSRAGGAFRARLGHESAARERSRTFRRRTRAAAWGSGARRARAGRHQATPELLGAAVAEGQVNSTSAPTAQARAVLSRGTPAARARAPRSCTSLRRLDAADERAVLERERSSMQPTPRPAWASRVATSSRPARRSVSTRLSISEFDSSAAAALFWSAARAARIVDSVLPPAEAAGLAWSPRGVPASRGRYHPREGRRRPRASLRAPRSERRVGTPSAAGGSRKTEVSAAASASGGASGARRRPGGGGGQLSMRSIFSLACWQRHVANASAAATIGGWCCSDSGSRSCRESNKYSRSSSPSPPRVPTSRRRRGCRSGSRRARRASPHPPRPTCRRARRRRPQVGGAHRRRRLEHSSYRVPASLGVA